MKVHVQTEVNGEAVEFLCDPTTTLLEVLRDNLGLRGSKEGCGTGDCGACSVELDGALAAARAAASSSSVALQEVAVDASGTCFCGPSAASLRFRASSSWLSSTFSSSCFFQQAGRQRCWQ